MSKAVERENVADDHRQRIRIKIKAYDSKIIDQSARTIMDTAKRSGADVVGPIPLPTEKNKYTVIRSPFVHKDSREQFEMRIHKRLIDIVEPTPKTIDALMGLNFPAGPFILKKKNGDKLFLFYLHPPPPHLNPPLVRKYPSHKMFS